MNLRVCSEKPVVPFKLTVPCQSNFFYINGHKTWVHSQLNVSDVSDTIFQKRFLFENMNFLLWVRFSQSHFYYVTDKFQSIFLYMQQCIFVGLCSLNLSRPFAVSLLN